MENTHSSGDSQRSDPPNQTIWLIGACVAILALVGVAAYFLAQGRQSSEELLTDDLVSDTVPELTDVSGTGSDPDETTQQEAASQETAGQAQEPSQSAPAASVLATTESSRPEPTTTSQAPASTTSPSPTENPRDETNSARQCYGSSGNVLALEFSDDVETFTGALQISQLGVTDLFAVSGRRLAGALFDVNVEAVAGGIVELQQWTATASAVSAGLFADLDALACSQIADAVAALDTAVTTFPEIP